MKFYVINAAYKVMFSKDGPVDKILSRNRHKLLALACNYLYLLKT